MNPFTVQPPEAPGGLWAVVYGGAAVFDRFGDELAASIQCDALNDAHRLGWMARGDECQPIDGAEPAARPLARIIEHKPRMGGQSAPGVTYGQ